MRHLPALSLACLLVAGCAHDEQAPGGRADLDLDSPYAAETPGLSDQQSVAADADRARFLAERDRRIDALIKNPPALTADRLPEGTKIGRCLFVVDGQTRISGACAYSVSDDGGLHIDGPKQVFEGIDYPEGGFTAYTISTDWWANVFKEHGVWTGYGNNDVSQTNGQGSYWGELKQEGDCFVSQYPWGKYKPGDYDPDYHPYDPRLQQNVRICLWRE